MEVLNINLPDIVLNSILPSFSFKWCTLELSYLGVKLTSDITILYQANYTPIYDTTECDLKTWKAHDLSCMGRIVAVKITVLPQILYYFWSLPSSVPPVFFWQLQTLRYKFIWNMVKCRVASSTLYRS